MHSALVENFINTSLVFSNERHLRIQSTPHETVRSPPSPVIDAYGRSTVPRGMPEETGERQENVSFM